MNIAIYEMEGYEVMIFGNFLNLAKVRISAFWLPE